MKGIHDSNWAWDEAAGQYYFHRFFDVQPDLNYHNPQVLLEMTRMLIRWKLKGVDGIRADAAPFLWKAEGTSCESLLPTHKIIKFFRAALDYLQPGTLLLAEACQPPKEVVAYLARATNARARTIFRSCRASFAYWPKNTRPPLKWLWPRSLRPRFRRTVNGSCFCAVTMS